MKKTGFSAILLFFCFTFSAFSERITLPINAEETGRETPVDFTVDWDENWFSTTPSNQYNHGIARMACILSEVSYVNESADPQLTQIKNVFRKLGVPDSKMEFHYDIDYNAAGFGNNQVAFSFASKEITLKGGVKKTLVFVVIRGTPFSANEWISNVNVADSSRKETLVHEGFFLAETKVHKEFIYYLLKMKINPDESYFLITGHSRGAAVANLMGANLVEEGYFKPENLFIYTFATPNVSQEEKTEDARYDFIWNIVSPEDIVPTVPMRKGNWNFKKFGNTRVFANRWNVPKDVYEDSYIPRINEIYQRLMERPYYPFETGYFIPMMITRLLTKVYPKISKYYKSSFSLRKESEKIFWSIFNPKKLEKNGKKNTSSFEKLLQRLNKATDGLVDYSSYAFLDMHICTNYLSWMLALEEDEVFSEKLCSVLIIRGPYESAVFDSNNELVLRIIDGMPQFKAIKLPIVAVPTPAGVIIGVPSCDEYTVVVYKDSLIPTIIPTKIEHYSTEGYVTEICPKKNLYPHKGMAYSFKIGERTATETQIEPHKSRSKATKQFIKEAKLKQQDVFRFQPEATLDTDQRFELGARMGTQMIHGDVLVGQSFADFGSAFVINAGIGHEETLVDRVLVDFAAYGKVLVATGSLDKGESRFNFVPSLRLSISYKPLHRQSLFVSGVFDFRIDGFNDKAFASDVRNTNFGTLYLSDDVGVVPSIRFGIRF